uniref:Uncharacterized protein n=1 Tax=Xiphophorus couchianus TaxID=32473 RepID=A0A3B5MU98_9TELE
MDSSSSVYPVETVPLQDRSHEASPGQPGDPTGVQHIVVNVPTEPPTDYLVWSLCNFVYGNIFCLGLAALIYSVKMADHTHSYETVLVHKPAPSILFLFEHICIQLWSWLWTHKPLASIVHSQPEEELLQAHLLRHL